MPGYNETISAATTLDTTNFFFSEKGYYQFDFKNATDTGTAAIELDFGAGLRLIETVDLTDTARDPFSVVGNIKSARVTPSQEMTMSVYCERA